MIVLRLARAASRSSWGLCVHPFLGFGGRRPGQGTSHRTGLGPCAKRERFRQDQRGNRNTVVVLARRHLVNSDIKLHHFKVPARKTSLEVSPQEEDRFLVITVRCDGGHDSALIAFRCDTGGPGHTGRCGGTVPSVGCGKVALNERTHGEWARRRGLEAKGQHGTLGLNQANISQSKFHEPLVKRIFSVFSPRCDSGHEPTRTSRRTRGLHDETTIATGS